MKIGQFIRLIRIPTLAATAVPLIVGGALGYSDGGKFASLLWLDILVVAVLMQIATNAMNEYGDYRRKIDTVPSAGFAGLIVTGETTAKEVLLTSMTCYIIALVLGIILVVFRGLPLLLLGIVAILSGILYSEGPLPVSSTPFGELLVALLMGPIEVVSANIAASGQISNLSFIFSIPVSLMVAAILLTNNLRDVDKDQSHGRRTFAVIVGKKLGSLVLLMLIVLTFLWSFPVFILFGTSASVFLLWFASPIALASYLQIMKADGWRKSVAVISRLDIVIGALLTLSILLHF
jgi:1,4-dihydroxy-2-naphthoate polyprenyltransferase